MGMCKYCGKKLKVRRETYRGRVFPSSHCEACKKDYMVMKKIFPTVCAVQNEGVGCFSYDNVEYITNNSEKQILSFDSDTTGVNNSIDITNMFGFDYCNVPKKYLPEGINDWADLAKSYGLRTIEEYLITKNIIR